MNMTTRCPECSTTFKVVADQLRISEGWVRCGQCGQVFDGNAHLQVSAKEAEIEPAPMPVGSATTRPPPAISPAAPAQPAVPSPGVAHLDLEISDHELTQFKLDHEDFDEDDSTFPDVIPSQADKPQVVKAVQKSATALAETTTQPVRGSARSAASAYAANAANATPERRQTVRPQGKPDVSFLRIAQRRAFWQKTSVRWILGLVAALLLLVLGLQIAVRERDRLVAMQPELKPVLLLLCDHLGCQIAPPRIIDAVLVDSSSFSRIKGDWYRMHVTLRNAGSMEVAIPSVELTLTDTRDEVLMRRVLSPAEMSAALPSLGTGAEWTAKLNVSVSNPTIANRVAGYRVLAFYP